ncbi:MAG: nucleoside-diphosphate kinase [Acidimicrobiales bacterium]
MERSLVICKPDSVERGLAGQILSRLEAKGLKLVAAELRVIDAGLAAQLYAEHAKRGFYADLVAFIGRSPSLVCVVEGPVDTWQIVRRLMGATNPAEANAGTIRGDMASTVSANLVHGSDSGTAALREIAIFFPKLG